jgi:type II secretory pathway pseudopilin PulG
MKKNKGFTLIEVIVAVLVAAMAVVAVFAVIVSTFTSAPKSDKKETAGLVMQQASEKLKGYVVDSTDQLPASIPINLCPVLDGTSALADGAHNASCLLDNTVLEGGVLTYTVANITDIGGLRYRKVDFSLEMP